MAWINLRTEFSFRQTYGHLDQVAQKCATIGTCGGIADVGNTFGHIRWAKACKKAGIKPIYGVRLPVFVSLEKERKADRNYMTFIAKTTKGLQEIYNLVDMAHEQFYYIERVTYSQVNYLSSDVAVLSGVAPKWDILDRPVYQELGPHIPYSQRGPTNKRTIACIDNFYPNIGDDEVYEPFADGLKLENKCSPMHIMTEEEWLVEFPGRQEALDNLKALTDFCNVTLPQAEMVKYIGSEDIVTWCKEGAGFRGIDIVKGEYADRYKREIKLIQEKDYADYFLVVADLIRYAKTRMCVGHGRGSSGGSLVCYLMGITEVDPLKYDLIFERFIDLNRLDLPDIDIDFQDDKRHLALKYLENKYGSANVAQLGNISRLKPTSAIAKFVDTLNIPLDEVDELKKGIIERPAGDKRANLCLQDSFVETEVGRRFIETYPRMKVVEKIEGHAFHTSVHAAAVLVCNEPISSYAGINCRDNKRIAMLDKRDAEDINLLKIDALGLRTLSILASVCDQIGKPYGWLYNISLDDEKTYLVLDKKRFNGIFQFEGEAIRGLAKGMPIDNIEDIAALSAVGRPGPMQSGGAHSYVEARAGRKEVKTIVDHQIVAEATKTTFGVIIYQEQVMKIVRELGKLSWKDTSKVRKVMGKSLGKEAFDKFFPKFQKGAIENGLEEWEAVEIWDHINLMGSYLFNKSHAVAYGMITYLCAYMKANHPLEFVVACLNHAKDDFSALKILRDAVENDGVEYKHIDKDVSVQNWSVVNGLLYGGFKTIHGIGHVMANKIVKARENGTANPKGVQAKLDAGVSEFKYLYPAQQIYGDYYDDYKSHGLNNPLTKIKDLNYEGCFTIIGCLRIKKLKDANEAAQIAKRDGKYEVGQTTWLNITLEDDTGVIMCQIKKADYNRIGRRIAIEGKENKNWYMVYGNKVGDFNLVFVKNIMNITRSLDDNSEAKLRD